MQKKTTILDLWKISKQANAPLLCNISDAQTIPFMSDYVTNYRRYDRFFVRMYGVFFPTWNRNYEDNDTDILNQFREDVFYLLYLNRENLAHLFSYNTYEYNPIENYDKISDIVNTESGTNTDTMNFAQDTVTHTSGARTTTDKVSPYDDTNFYNENQTEQGQAIDTDVTAAKIDSKSTLFGHKNTMQEHTHGNVGVTATYQLLEGDSRFWSKFNPWYIVFKLIVIELCRFFDCGRNGYQICFNEYIADLEEDMDVRLSVTEVEGGVMLTAVDSHGVTTAMVHNGTPGATGEQGPQGEPGPIPAFKIENGHLYVDRDGDEK